MGLDFDKIRAKSSAECIIKTEKYQYQRRPVCVFTESLQKSQKSYWETRLSDLKLLLDWRTTWLIFDLMSLIRKWLGVNSLSYPRSISLINKNSRLKVLQKIADNSTGDLIVLLKQKQKSFLVVSGKTRFNHHRCKQDRIQCEYQTLTLVFSFSYFVLKQYYVC